MILADDILKALTDSYSSAASNIDNDKQNVNQAVGRTVATKRMKEYAEELKNIKDIRKAEADRYKELYKAELNAGKYSQKVKADLLKQEISHYTSLYNLNNDLHKKQTALLEAERDIYKNINDNGKITLKNQSELYSLKLKEQQLEKQTAEYKIKKFEENVNKVKKGFETVVSHVFKRIDELDNIKVWDNWIKGISDLQTQYESNFTEMSGRLGVASGIDTHNLIGNVLDNVKSNDIYMKGLNFNNEVFPQIADAVKRGFQGEDAEKIGLSTAIDKKIMPWLDTSSDTWTDLQYNLDDRLLNQLKGQQLQLQATQEGNRILQNGVASQITDSLAPTLLNIDANTTDVSALSGQAQAMVSSLMDNGYSKQDAIKMANQVIDAYQNPFKALTSGSTADKLYALGGLQGGDIASSLNFANKFLQTGANGNWATSGAFLAQGFIGNGQTRTTDWIKDIGKATEAANNYTGSDFEGTYNDKVNNLTEYVTATQKNDNEKQNESVIRYFNDAFGNHKLDIDKMILEEIKGIKSWLITGLIAGLVSQLGSKVIDKIASNLGSGSKGTSLVSNLFTGGSGLKKAIEYGSEAYTTKMGAGTGLQYGGLVGGLTQGGSALSGGLATGAGATAIGTLGLTGGALMIGKGVGIGVDTIKNWDKSSTGDKVAGGASSIGAIAGGGMLGAAALGLASGPVGWAGLAIGGIALAGKAIYDYNKKMQDACTNVDILGSSFETLRNQIKQNTNEKLKELDSIRKNFYSLGDETKQRELLINKGIIPNTDKTKLSTEMLEKYIEKMDIVTSDSGEKQEEVLGGLEAKYTAQSKNEIKSMIDQIYGSLKGKDEATQRKLLSELGFSDEQIDAGMKNRLNGAMSDGELWEFLAVNDTKMKGVEIGSLQEKLESGEINENTLNRYASKHNITSDRITSKEKWMSSLGEIVEAVDYLDRYKKFGRENNPEIASGTDAVGFNQDTYDQYKKYILSLGKGNKDKVADVFTEYNINLDALSDYPNSLKGFKVGSSYIPYDMIAQLHAGERVLTANQNKEYTQELQTGNGSIIVNGIQDVVSAIQNQTKTIIDYLSTMNFNNSSGFKKLSMLPSMGNTKVTL